MYHLPFAGITLFRFNGYFSAEQYVQHPEDVAKIVLSFLKRV
jgi:hypothetical protein